VGVSALVTFLCVAINYLLPQGALVLLMSLVVAALVINWTMISLTHLKFRRALQQQGRKPYFKALWAPLGNYLCLGFVVLILGIMLLDASVRLSVLAMPLWILFIWLWFAMRELARRREVALRR